MKVGVLLCNQAPPREPIDRVLREIAEQVDAVETLGFDSVWDGQHFLSDYQELQPVPLLSWLAGRTRRVHLGTGVLLLPLYHPLTVAEELASLDVLSGGRLIAGFGLGYRDTEFDAFGVPSAEAPARLVDGVEAIKRLWAEEAVTYQGRTFHLEAATIRPRPVQRPHPPIWIAANVDRAVRRAARIGDAWFANPHATRDVIARQVQLFRGERDRLGLPAGEIPLMRELHLADRHRQAFGEVEPYLMAKYARYIAWGQERAMGRTGRLSLPFAELCRDRFLVGDPTAVREEIKGYQATAGVTHLVVRVQWPGLPNALAMRTLRLFAERVLPWIA